MRWEDERWVKVYTRDTGEWLALGWEAQALFLLLLRKSDRAGLIHSGRARIRGLAALAGMPLDVVERAVPLLLEDGCLRETDKGYLIPNFIAAQEAETSGAQRTRTMRERDRDKAMAEGIVSKTAADTLAKMARSAATQEDTRGETLAVTPAVTQDVTHVATQDDTPRVDESRVEETREDLFPEVATATPAPAKKAREAKKGSAFCADPRHAPLSLALTALGWPHHGGRTAKALKDLLALADQIPATAGDKAQAEIMRRAAKAKSSTGFPQVRELHELATHWGHFSGPPAPSSALPRADDPDWVTV